MGQPRWRREAIAFNRRSLREPSEAEALNKFTLAQRSITPSYENRGSAGMAMRGLKLVRPPTRRFENWTQARKGGLVMAVGRRLAPADPSAGRAT